MSIKLQPSKVLDLRPRLTVIGVGGAGGNAVNNMIATGLTGVEFVVANTDAQALQASSAEKRIQLGIKLTEGLGAGSKPEIGEAAAEEALDDIQAHVTGQHMVFVAAGMGGGTGTGAAAVIARIAKDCGVLVVGIVTKPFQFEGARRLRVAEAGVAELKKHVDTLIVIPNQNLFRIANEKTTFSEAFVRADQVLYSGISCIVDLVVKEGLINLDFADVRTILAGMGTAMMGTGEARGERRAIRAAEEAIANPLLDEVSLRGAKGLLLSITGGRDLKLFEVDEAASRVRKEVDVEANIIVGATVDESLGDSLRVSIVASGMNRIEAPHTLDGLTTARAGQPQLGEARGPAPPPLPRYVQPDHPNRQVRLGDLPHPSMLARGGVDNTGPRLPRGDALAAGSGYGNPEDDHSPEAHSNGGAGPGQMPWRAPGDVYIEEGPPQLMPAPAGGAGYALPPTHQQVGFTPAAPNDVRRQKRGPMPARQDFPAVGQRDDRAEAATVGSRFGVPAAKNDQSDEYNARLRKPGLLERLTSRAWRRVDGGDSRRASRDRPQGPVEQSETRGPAQVRRGPTMAGEPPGAPDSAPQKRPAAAVQDIELSVFYSKNGR